MSVYDTRDETTRDDALQAAHDAIRDGLLIVLPTDTVYGIGADAFTPDAVQALLEAKDRGRDVPPPVLVGDPAVLLGLAVDVPEYAERLTEAFWPGPLTLILNAQPSLNWDLGETRGTVALRMPDDEIALELLRRTGPLAVSSANRHGRPSALSVMDAATQLGDRVEVYLEGGPARLGTASTIIDTTVEPAEIVREGALTREQIVEAVGDIFTVPATEEPATEESASDEAASDEAGTDAPRAAEESAPEGERVEGIGDDAFAAAEAAPLSATAPEDGASAGEGPAPEGEWTSATGDAPEAARDAGDPGSGDRPA
ncbi:threonylcarbamoyl-AMP synthase [Brachybacterium endophyticum]|uniref:L-threonylcarbamoyladenylate synthase n=1 Tax=Brachybacterium endophyticum TaxID=2182385 RepID=A0A2U2RHR3_9MICO|nr:L-threonylcarbamoyladenylate synthase [Brachybacterium endophyticum]PWH05390.1 threonylcarbamoyl-AMP synthase [Brachybacterium endophyticum]